MWILLIASILIYLMVHMVCRVAIQRIFFGAFVLSFYMYNGFGVVYGDGVSDQVVHKYIVFLSVSAVTYILSILLLYSPSRHVSNTMTPYLDRLVKSDYFVYPVIVLYLGVLGFDLVYPEFNIHRLINPPRADVLTQFQENLEVKITGNFNPISKAVDTLGFLLFPLYMLTLYRYRSKPAKLLALIIIPLYLHYCVHSYINRAKMLEGLLLFGSLLWIGMPNLRKVLTTAGLILLPLLPIGLVQYAYIRSDQDVVQINTADATLMIVYNETQMPVHSEQIFNSKQRIDLPNYFYWLVTLPIPKVVIGAVPPVAAAAEMSEIILGKKRGEEGYFAKLAGLLNESVYIFGNKYYWVHALLVGFVIAFSVRMVQFTPHLVPIAVILLMLVSYTINRAGMGSVLPFIINRLFALHVFMIFVYLMHIFYLPYARNQSLTTSGTS